MPTFDALTGGSAGNPLVLLAACLMLGIAVGVILFVLMAALQGAARPVVLAVIGDAQRRIRREQATQESTLFGMTLAVLPAIVPAVRALPLDAMRQSLGERYAAAGWPGGLDDDEVVALALLAGLVLTAVLGVLILMTFGVMFVPLALAGLVLGPGLVSSNLASRGARRERSITRTMPYVLDLLTLTMRAGASLLQAIQRVTVDFGDQPIGVEFRATLTDMEMGLTTKESFEGLARRAPIPSLKQFVDDLVQSDELGRPLADALESLSDRERVRRVQDAIDTAGKAKAMVMVPGTLVLLATMLLLFSPFIVKFYYEGVNVG